jgi:hypothetical protein
MSLNQNIFKNAIILFCCLIILGCKKHLIDYRNKFIGDYHFSITETGHDLYAGYYDTTYTDEGKIWYGSDSHTVLISLSGGKSFEPRIYEDGTLSDNGCGGEFETLSRVSYGCVIPSPAVTVSFHLIGERK